jgi:heat shock protein HslJ
MNAKHSAVLVLSAIVLLSVAACSLPGLPGLPSTDPLKGTSWRLVMLGGAGLLPGTQITATFEDGQVHGQACNSYGGAYKVSGDKISISELCQTEMACVDPPGVMEQERRYLEMLSMAKTFKLSDSQLQIFSATGEVLTFLASS